jgi:hypothetical protein
MSKFFWLTTVLFATLSTCVYAQQPRITPGPSEPDWVAILDAMYGLRMIEDLENPVVTDPLKVPGLFRKAGPGPVTYTPVIALGLVTVNRGGWYTPGPTAKDPAKHEVWSYQQRNTAKDIESQTNLPPKLASGSKTTFDPGVAPFGVWVANDGLNDGGVFTEPQVVQAINARLAKQPYKAMIYRLKDKATGKVIPGSYLIGWEYSTNDDFQDVVCRLDNVELIKAPSAK